MSMKVAHRLCASAFMMGGVVACSGCSGVSGQRAAQDAHQLPEPGRCIDNSMAIVAVGENATATINRLSSSAIDDVQSSGVHQFLVAVANTTTVIQHFDPDEHIEVIYEPARPVHKSVFCGSDLRQSSREKCQESLVARSRNGQRVVPLISSNQASLATRGRIGQAVSVQKLPYANTVLENVVLSPEPSDSAEQQPLTESGVRTIVPELEVAEVAPGEKFSGTMALDVGDAIEGGNIAVRVRLGRDTHEFVYCVAGLG